MSSFSLHRLFSFIIQKSLLFTLIMITFKKSVYSFLCSFTDFKDRGTVLYCSLIHNRNVSVPVVDDLSFLTVLKTQPPVVESAAVKPPPLPPPPTRRDPGGIGFLDEVGGNVNGLMSCTESLGFESSDERRIDDRMFEDFQPTFSSRSRRNGITREVKKFPPLLSSLNYNGKPNFFLRQVRTNGRLEITKVKIQRPEILHASRQNGRLRLDFIIIEDEENDVEEVSRQNQRPGLDFAIDEEVENIEDQNEDKKEEVKVEGEVEESTEEEKKEREVDGWNFLAKSGGRSESFRRCHELSHRGNNHHHHNLHVWSQPCVTIR